MRRVLLFDVLGTLVHDPFYVEMPAFFGIPFDALLRDKHPTTWLEFELGKIDADTACARFFRDGRAFSRERFEAFLKDAYRWIDGMEALVAELAAKGVEMHAFSNYPEIYRLIEERCGVSRYVRWSVVSCAIGARKPAREAYERALEIVGAPPDEVIFVDDREENCAPARALGIRAFRFESAAKLRAELAGEGLVGR